ncbi:hypothetical protein GMRT_13229 [Giardia muris]|uniref:Uncharacterized protein n=1 Tax=Giardia muris TaxID=5742 RepID=A0A4Z1T3Z8_GIAMU|nr:hypothetical protein GMRT_13229 [Giardia muris]|eukprot:TNJ28703.1 hypothetical protein GMRT_13229 [Giardia muris]
MAQATSPGLDESPAALRREVHELRQKLFAAERRTTEVTNSLRDECARERARYRALEAKMDEFQLTTERHATRRIDDMMIEQRDLRSQLSWSKDRIRELERELDTLSHYASERINITRRMEIAESRVADLEATLNSERKQNLAGMAEQRANLELAHKKALEEAVEEALKKANESVSQETKLLREQNKSLQRSITLLKTHGPSTLGQSSGRGLTSIAHKGGSGATKGGLNRSRVTSQIAADLSHFAPGDVERYEEDVSRSLELRVGELGITIKTLQTKLEEQALVYKREKAEASTFIAGLITKFTKERNDLLFEIKSLEKLVYAKCKELYKIRTLAQLILQRRTDLEAFLAKVVAVQLDVTEKVLSPKRRSTYFPIDGVGRKSYGTSPARDRERSTSPLPIDVTKAILGTEPELQSPDQLPRTMVDMEAALNAPIKTQPTRSVEELSSEDALHMIRDWIRAFDMPL